MFTTHVLFLYQELCPCPLAPIFPANRNSSVLHHTGKAEQGCRVQRHLEVLLEGQENLNCWINFQCHPLAPVLELMMTAKMEAVVRPEELPKYEENPVLLERWQFQHAFQKMAVNGVKGTFRFTSFCKVIPSTSNIIHFRGGEGSPKCQ